MNEKISKSAQGTNKKISKSAAFCVIVSEKKKSTDMHDYEIDVAGTVHQKELRPIFLAGVCLILYYV